ADTPRESAEVDEVGRRFLLSGTDRDRSYPHMMFRQLIQDGSRMESSINQQDCVTRAEVCFVPPDAVRQNWSKRRSQQRLQPPESAGFGVDNQSLTLFRTADRSFHNVLFILISGVPFRYLRKYNSRAWVLFYTVAATSETGKKHDRK